MKYYPVLLNLKDRTCLVVGGGAVGARKARGLVRSGARVKVVARKFLGKFPREAGVTLETRPYEKRDMDNVFMVFAATDNARLNQQILTDARESGVLASLADAPEQGDFIRPSVLAKGDLVFAVSTSGASPALTKKIKEDLDQTYGREYEIFLTLMKSIRKKLLASGHDPDRHRKIFTALVERDLPAMIAAGNMKTIDLTLTDILGRGFAFHDLVA